VAALVVTELLTNAVVHGGLPAVVRLRAWDCWVSVEVQDTATEALPKLTSPDPWVPGGRGLWLVDALSVAWGWRPDVTGKAVWALISADAADVSE
jgi:anti-sigma regulatory factor (Ser/Thr protein kinase)